MSEFEEQRRRFEEDQRSVWIDVVDAVRTLMETFKTDTLEGLQHADPLLASLEKVETHERRRTTYALVAFAGATIRWAASELSRDEIAVLVEVARGFEVELD
jgi:hypothetical protein